MGNENYWDRVTEETPIEWLRMHNLMSTRTSNVLTRGARYERKNRCYWEHHPISTVKELLEVDECELKLYRNMGAKCLAEIEEFKQKFLEKSTSKKMQDTNELISVSAFKEYLNKCKQTAQSHLDKAITIAENGTGSLNELQMYKYFNERVRLFEYEIPKIIKAFLEDNENGRKEIDR